MGLLLACILLLYFVLRGLLLGYDDLAEQGESLEQVLALYLLGGAGGGLVLGLLLPWARQRLGAALVGMAVVLPFFLLQARVEAGRPGGEGPIPSWAVVTAAVLVGGLAGYLVRTHLLSDIDADESVL